MPKPVDWRALPPVPESERPHVEPDWKPSQTFLKLHDRCDRSAMLYLLFRAGAGGHELNRGSIFHDVWAELTEFAIREGEHRIPPEMGKDALLAYYERNPEVQVNAQERDALRYMIANACTNEYLDPTKIIAVETTFQLEIGGFIVVGRIDRADHTAPGRLDVIDYKTAYNMPDRDDFIPQSFAPDGRPYFSGNFQTMLYALGLAFGVLDDGLRLEGFEEYGLRLVFPRHVKNGALGERSVVVTSQQLLDFKFDVESQLRRLREVNLGEGRWQATPGNHCRECPAEFACPLPRLLRPESQHANLASLGDLEKLAANVNFMGGRTSTLKARLKKAAERLEQDQPGVLDLPDGMRGVRIGDDLAFVFQPYERESVGDKVALQEAAKLAAHTDGNLDLDWHFKTSSGTEFKKRKVGPRPRERKD